MPSPYIRQDLFGHRSLHSVGGVLLAAGFAALLMATGGASRYDAASQVLVRSLAVATIVIAVARRGNAMRIGALLPAYCFLGAVAGTIALQLIPLPPSVWSALPGRSFYVQAMAVVGEPQGWRPLTLVPDLTWNALLGLLPGAALLVLMTAAREDERDIALYLLVASVLASAMLGIAQMAGGPESALRFYRVTSLGSPTGFLANRNHQSALMACAIPAIGMLLTRPLPVLRTPAARMGTAGAITLVLLMLLIANGSRAGLLLMAIAMLAASPFWWAAIPRSLSFRVRTTAFLAVMAASGVLLAGVAIVFNRGQSIGRLLNRANDLDMRESWLAPGQVMLTTFFPAGIGVGGFDAVFRTFEPFEMLNYDYANELHNDLIQVAIEAGILGVALMAVYAIWWLRQAWIIYRTPTSTARSYALLGLAITAMLIVASGLDYPLRVPILAATFVLGNVWMLAVGARAAAPTMPVER